MDPKQGQIAGRQILTQQKFKFGELVSALAKGDMKTVDEMLVPGHINSSSAIQDNPLKGKRLAELKKIQFFEGEKDRELLGIIPDADGTESWLASLSFTSDGKVKEYSISSRI